MVTAPDGSGRQVERIEKRTTCKTLILDLNNTLLPTLEARGLIDTKGPFSKEGD
jgi:hypothetical protein